MIYARAHDYMTIILCPELSDSFDWASYLMEGIEYPTYSDSDEVKLILGQ